MKNIFILLAAILFTISSCRKDEHLMEVVPGTGTTEITEESGLTGIVVDVDGNSDADAEVSIANAMTTTDENGVYFSKVLISVVSIDCRNLKLLSV